jgi:hypothetical protein
MQFDLKTLETLGITKEDFIERIVSRAAGALLHEETWDEDGDPVHAKSGAARTWDKMIRERLDAKVKEIGEQHVMPLIDAKVADLVLQETNRWGERTGKPLTLTEYLVAKAEAYMGEEVDYSGKPRAQSSYNWRGEGTRIAYAVNSHMQYAVETAMKEVIKNANQTLVEGLTNGCKIKLQEIANSITVNVAVKR